MNSININYKKKYIYTYIWQTTSILLGFVSLFIVTPYISSDKVLYGIYSICISLTIYFSYADLGVLSAVSKYAAEYFIKGDLNSEMRLMGFSSFIMFFTFSLISLAILAVSIWPTAIIPDLTPESKAFYIARYLLLTLALSSPILIFQRVLSCIFLIRVEIYKFQRILFWGNILRILSVFYFFHGGRYEIVGYYIFYQCVNVVVILACLIAIKGYGYSLKRFITYFKFDFLIFSKVKNLSGMSILSIVITMLMVEFDNLLIARFCGIESVAIYAIGLNLFSIVRTYNGIVYAPFSSRFNHFVGLSDNTGLCHFTTKLTVMTAPVIVIPVLIIALMCEPFIVSWVGPAYCESGLIASFLVLYFGMNFISMPASSYFNAKVKLREMFFSLIIPLFIFLFGIIVTSRYIGVLSFGVCKSLAAFISSIYIVCTLAGDYRNMGETYLSSKHIFSIIITVVTTCIICLCLRNIMSYEKSKINLLYNMLIMGISFIISFTISIPFNQFLKCEAKAALSRLLKKEF